MIKRGCLVLMLVFAESIVNASLQGQTKLWGSELYHISSYEQVFNICMDLWTYLDLVRAICTTAEQREEICCDLTEIIRDIYKHFLAFERTCHTRTHDGQKALIDILETVQKAFMTLFCDAGAAYHKEGIMLLSCLLAKLKAPNNIAAEGTANSVR